jgi:catechol 2,3-dioxygenase-like lactoylglutathione lyase family enzyme
MYDHIGIKVKDLGASVRFYSAALAPLGFVLCSQDESSAGFGPAGSPALWIGVGKYPTNATHIALRAPNRRSVELFHGKGLAAGGGDNGGPGLRSDYSPTYYAAFLIDPDGNNVEAVYMGA